MKSSWAGNSSLELFLMCPDKFVDFSLNIVLRDFLEDEQVNAVQDLIKLNTMQVLHLWSHDEIQRNSIWLDALIWPVVV